MSKSNLIRGLNLCKDTCVSSRSQKTATRYRLCLKHGASAYRIPKIKQYQLFSTRTKVCEPTHGNDSKPEKEHANNEDRMGAVDTGVTVGNAELENAKDVENQTVETIQQLENSGSEFDNNTTSSVQVNITDLPKTDNENKESVNETEVERGQNATGSICTIPKTQDTEDAPENGDSEIKNTNKNEKRAASTNGGHLDLKLEKPTQTGSIGPKLDERTKIRLTQIRQLKKELGEILIPTGYVLMKMAQRRNTPKRRDLMNKFGDRQIDELDMMDIERQEKQVLEEHGIKNPLIDRETTYKRVLEIQKEIFDRKMYLLDKDILGVLLQAFIRLKRVEDAYKLVAIMFRLRSKPKIGLITAFVKFASERNMVDMVISVIEMMDQTNEARQKMLQSNNKDVYRDKATNGSRPDERATDEISRVMDAQQEQQMYEYLIKTMLSMDHSELGYIYFNSRKGKGVSIELVDMLISKMCVDNEIELACKTYVDLLNQKIKLNYSNDINSGGGIASNIDPENSAVLLPATSLRLLREISRTLDLPDINIDGGNENSSNTIAGNNTGTASKSNGTSMIELLWKKCTQVHKLQLTESDCLGVLNVASRYGKTGLASDVLQTLLGILKQKKIALTSSVPPTSNLSSLMALAMTNTTSSMELLQEYHLEPLFEAFLTARNYRRAFETLHLMRANKMGHGTDTCITITRHLLSTYKDSVKHNMVIEKILGELYNCKYSPKRTNAIDESDPSQKDLDSRLSNKNNNNNSNPSYGKFPKAVTARTVDAILKYYFHTKQLNLGISKTEFYYQKFELEKNYLTILMMLEGCFISNNYYTAKLIYNSSPILPPVLSKHTGSQFAQNKAKGRNSFLSPGDVGSLAPNSSMDAREYLPRIYKLMILISLNSQNYEDSFIYLEAIKNTGTIPSYEIYSKIALKCEYYKDPRLEAIIEEMRLYGYNTNNAF